MGQQRSLRWRERGRITRNPGPRRGRLPCGFEPVLLVAGVLLSLAAGVAAYRAVGPYGDGPFGAGFRRIPADSPEGTLLVHDSRVGRDLVRAVIEEATGRVRELRLASGGDLANALRVELNEHEGVRVPHDLDGDGITDRWDYYADVRHIESGDVERVGFSLAGDGITDAWAFHDERGQLTRVEVSTLRDGVVDRWEHYSDAELVRVEADVDLDGRVDTWSSYRDGVLTATATDTDGDGKPDSPGAGER